MIYLILSIFFSTANHLIFRAFTRFDINLKVAVCFNYFTCTTVGYISSGLALSGPDGVFAQRWYIFSLLQGLLLFSSFMSIGLTTRHLGVSVSGLSTRLSVAIPTICAFFLYRDTVSFSKLSGIGLAMAALLLSSFKKKDNPAFKQPAATALFPIVSFLFFGTHATLLKFVQTRYLSEFSYHGYVMASFFAAFAASAIFTGADIVIAGLKLRLRDALAGIFLGLVNYGAVYFLIRTLGVPGWQSSQIFPTISISVVVLSSFCAWLIFKETIGRQMFAAIGIGILAIWLINI